jgi:hypothetical protein
MRGDVGKHNRVGTDSHIVANTDRAQDLGAGADIDAIANHR